MLHVSGRNPLKASNNIPKINEIFKSLEALKTKPERLSKPEILQALDLSLSNLDKKNVESDELLSKIEKEANKIHESLKKLRKSAQKSDKSAFSEEQSNHSNISYSRSKEREREEAYSKSKEREREKAPEAYDSDPEYQNYQRERDNSMRNRAFSDDEQRDNENYQNFSEEGHLNSSLDKWQNEKNKYYNNHNEHQSPNSQIKRLNYKDYGKYEAVSKEKKMSFTIPKPFRFENRELTKPDAISKKRFLYDLELKKTKELDLKKHRFRANPIPEHIKDRHLFTKIMKEQEKRREDVKKNSKILTLQREKPFSFYQRDKIPKKTEWERKKFRFQANPIPWFCSVPLLQIMEEQGEAERRERVAKEAQLLMSISHLPSRMEKHEQEKKANELKGMQTNEKRPNTAFSFQPERRKPVPEFSRLHASFQMLLDRKRSNMRPNIPQPFDFTSNKRAQKREYLDQENIKIKDTEILKKKKTVYKEKMPEIQPPSTKKWEQAYEMNMKKHEIDQKNKLEEQKRLEERERKRKEIEIRVKGSPAIVDNRKELEEKKKKIIETRKKEIKDTEEHYKKTLEEINDRVRKRLLLVENYEEGSRKARKRKLMEKKQGF